jgi:hypothetical protein
MRNSVCPKMALLLAVLVFAAVACDSSDEPIGGESDTSGAPTQPEGTSVAGGLEVIPAIDDVLGCSTPAELNEIFLLLRSGQPTYDYQPALDLAQLVGWTDVSVSGSIDSAVRTTDNSYTVLSVSNVEVLSGSGYVGEFSSSSLWASGQGPDPIADEVKFDDLRFVALLSADPDAPGGWQPYAVEGLLVGCDDDSSAVGSLASVPSYLAGLSLDEIADAIRAVDD